MREWIMRGLTGRIAGIAESCDSTKEKQKTDSGLICISNSPDFQPVMPETCWFALYSPPLSLSISFHLNLHFSLFFWFTTVIFFPTAYFLFLLQIGLVSQCVSFLLSPSFLFLSSTLLLFIFYFYLYICLAVCHLSSPYSFSLCLSSFFFLRYHTFSSDCSSLLSLFIVCFPQFSSSVLCVGVGFDSV